ncbi:MAG: hypothetical protein HY036_01645 [Nitrospirae bacterium]|nr:hypothetical protein [Nitrospirota bacterium]
MSNTPDHNEPEMTPYAQPIFRSLNLSEKERKFIEIYDDQTVRFQFPFEVHGISVGGQPLKFDKEAEMDLYDRIVEFFTEQMDKGGFRDNFLFTIPRDCRKEMDFYKEFNSEAEAKEAVKWLLTLKKRFRI